MYHWDNTLETGYPKVDNQHKQLIAALNDLIEANNGGHGNIAVLETLDFLINYTIKHFNDEEALQVMYEYPEYAAHKRIHDEFKTSVNEVVARVRQEGPSEALISEVCQSLGNWVLNHIRGDDFRMAAFVKAIDNSFENQGA